MPEPTESFEGGCACGSVRYRMPEDVTANNRVNHTQIAEARISYGGRGTISAVQRPNWGQRVGDAITPW
jgi:flagellar basal body L-ring protein FlgH